MKVLGRTIFPTVKVISVEERFQDVNWHTDPDTKEPTCDKKSLGWWVRYENSSAIWFGSSRPDLEVGDTIRVIMEKVDGKA